VKDTIHKHSLLYHMTYWVMEAKPEASDLYSEIGAVTRASRTDFGEVSRMRWVDSRARNYAAVLSRPISIEKKLLIAVIIDNYSHTDNSK
jgi:hypothetical protein